MLLADSMMTFLIVAAAIWALLALVLVLPLCAAARRPVAEIESVACFEDTDDVAAFKPQPRAAAKQPISFPNSVSALPRCG